LNCKYKAFILTTVSLAALKDIHSLIIESQTTDSQIIKCAAKRVKIKQTYLSDNMNDMHLLKYPKFLLIILMSAILTGFAVIAPDCTQLKKGKFHSYNKQGIHIIINRIDGIQQDINTQTKDTTYWKIDWLDNCRFAASFLTGSGPKTPEEKNFYQSTVLFYEVIEIADNYYIGTTTVKAPNGTSSSTDTTWLVEKNKY